MTPPTRPTQLLAYEEAGSGEQTVILLHGCGLDRSSLAAQTAHLSQRFRVISPDIRGHGGSKLLGPPYDMDTLADDVANLCKHLQVSHAVIIGHSMGGNLALSLQQRHPDHVAALLLFDSALFIPEPAKQQLQADFVANPTGTQLLSYYKGVLKSLCLPGEQRSQRLVDDLAIDSDLLRAILGQTTIYPSRKIVAQCKVPLGYVHSSMPLFDLAQFQQACAQLMYAQTLGAGHFAPVEVPGQVNAMIDTFLDEVSASS